MKPHGDTSLNNGSEQSASPSAHPRSSIISLGRILFGYLLAVIFCGTVLLIRFGIGFAPGAPPMLVLYMIPVIASAYVGGIGPGLFCTILAGFLTSYYLLAPYGAFSVNNTDSMLNLAAMLLTGAVISLLVDSLHRLRGKTEESQERYRIVADNTYDWEFWVDAEGKSIYQSPSCKRVTGYDASVFLADPKHLERIVHPDDLAKFKSHRHGVVSDQTEGELQFRIIRPDGEIRWIEHFCLPVFGQDGAYLGTRGSNSDITERKRIEEVVVQTEKMVSVGGLAAGMAHEINNPLGGILQGLQNIRRRISLDLPANIRTADEQHCSLEAVRKYLEARQVFEFLDAMEESGQKAAQIVGNMLELSRNSASEKVLASVDGIIESAIRLCSTGYALPKECDCSNVLIERDFDPGAPKVPCIPPQIEQVVVNLLQNAVQAMSGGQGFDSPAKITIRTKGEPDAIRIVVEDNGPGMEPSVLKHAFDPFFTTKSVGKGAGLGLSVAYFIVTSNHGGTIEVKSRPGKGTRFIIRLPLEQAGNADSSDTSPTK